MAATKKQLSLTQQIMAEHINMPGFPQIIVTRAYVYDWLKSHGWQEGDYSRGGIAYTVFSRPAVKDALTPPDERDTALNDPTVQASYTRET